MLKGRRCKGGRTLEQAIYRNKGTCWQIVIREKAQAENLQGDYPDVDRGGPSRSSDETPVMGVDQRTWPVRFYSIYNRKKK